MQIIIKTKIQMIIPDQCSNDCRFWVDNERFLYCALFDQKIICDKDPKVKQCKNRTEIEVVYGD